MAKGAAAGKAGEGKPEGKDDGQKAADDAAAKAAAAAEGDKSGDDAGDKAPPAKKSEKTYSKAEVEAEKQRAIAAEKQKWEEEKDLTELERIKKENEELRAANRLRDAKDEVVAALTAAGNRSPELAFRAIQGDLRFDDSGKLLNTKDLIDSFKTSYPDQFGTEKPKDGVDAGAGQGQKGTALTEEAIKKMTPAEINANWQEVSKVLGGK